MKKIIRSSLLLYFLIGWKIHLIKAQEIERCSSMEYEQFVLSKDTSFQRKKEETNRAVQNYIQAVDSQKFKIASAVIRIPVVVHIIGDNAISLTTVTDVYDQIKILNEDFRKLTGTNGDGAGVDTKIEFCLATRDPAGLPTGGIFTYEGTYGLWNHSAPDAAQNSDLKLKSIAHWSPYEYLNIYVADLCCNGLGYATFPWELSTQPERDGFVVDPHYFGYSSDPRYNSGRTATHEIGHWLGLNHTWGHFPNGAHGNCTIDDEVDDTPVCDGPNFAKKSVNCTPHPNQCNAENNAAGLTDLRQIENYMDYSDDLCMNMFTQGQAKRMLSYLNTVRTALSLTACADPYHCSNSIQDADETGLDCGGVDCPPCPLPNEEEFAECGLCWGNWPNFRINGIPREKFRVWVCSGDLISITTDKCKFWDCFDTYFSIQQCNYYATPIGPEYSKWFQSPDVVMSLYNLASIAGATIYEGNYYRVKFANYFPVSWGGYGWAETVRMIYVVPENLYYDNVTMGSNFPEYSYALNNIAITGNSKIESGHSKTFIAQNEIFVGTGFSAEEGSSLAIKMEPIPCPTFRLANPADDLEDTIAYSDLKETVQKNNILHKEKTTNQSLFNPENLQNIPTITILPNPSGNGIYTVSGMEITGTSSIKVFNVLGEKVFESLLGKEISAIVDISTQPKGVYFVKVQNREGEMTVQKVVYQ